MVRANVKINFKLRSADVKRLGSETSRKAARKAAEVSRSRVRNNLSNLGRYDTNHLDSSMQIKDITKTPDYARFAVGSPAHYAKYQEFGTRDHGPVRAKVLRFKPKGSTSFVFAKWVRGVKPGKFMERALRALTVYDFID